MREDQLSDFDQQVEFVANEKGEWLRSIFFQFSRIEYIVKHVFKVTMDAIEFSFDGCIADSSHVR